MNTPFAMRGMARVGAVVTLLALCLFGVQDLHAAPPEPVATSAAPCLADDPFRLADLAAVLSSNTPPSTPVTIGRHITVQFIRSGSMVAGPEDRTGQDNVPTGSPEPREMETSTMPLDGAPMRVFNSRTKFEFRVTMSDNMLKSIYECHESAGLTDAGGPADLGVIEGKRPTFLPALVSAAGRSAAASAFQAVEPDGWSNNNDSRVVRSPTTLWPWRAIAQVAGNQDSRCTMTLVGPRHMITAAHCIVPFGTSNWSSWTLTPGRDGVSLLPYGSTSISPNPPAGTEAWYFVPDPWLNPNTTNKYQWDIGAVVVLDRVGDQTGWMGYGAYSASDLNKRDHYNRGYPSCQSDYVEKPAGCQTARLYGDTKTCKFGSYYNSGSNGWNRNISVSCDLSRGHSGSAIYHYRYDSKLEQTVPVVTAVVSWHECLTCDKDDDYPNHVRRITPWVRDVISWLREEFP